MGQQPTTGSPTLSGWFPAGARSRPRATTTPQVGGALGTGVFQRRPRQVRICSTRAQGPGTTIGRFPIIGSSVRHSFRTGRNGIGVVPLSGGRTPNRVGRTGWTARGGEKGTEDDRKSLLQCFSSSDEARPCNEEGERCWCSISTCLSLLSRDHGPSTRPVLLVGVGVGAGAGVGGFSTSRG